MATVEDALTALNIEDWVIRGIPENEAEFNSMFRKVTGVTEDGTAIESDNIDDFDVTWAQVETKLNELNASEPLDNLRAVRNAKLTETDWVVTMHKELGTNIPAAWKTYRQALRDITDTYTSLDDVVWPEKP